MSKDITISPYTSVHLNTWHNTSIYLNTRQQSVSIPVHKRQYVLIHLCSIHHTYTHDSKKVKHNVSTNFNRTEQHAPFPHTVASLLNIRKISTSFIRIFSRKLTVSRYCPEPHSPSFCSSSPGSHSFNSLNNRPICTKRCMDVMPLWTAVTFQR
jgi:hypothetical protein